MRSFPIVVNFSVNMRYHSRYCRYHFPCVFTLVVPEPRCPLLPSVTFYKRTTTTMTTVTAVRNFHFGLDSELPTRSQSLPSSLYHKICLIYVSESPFRCELDSQTPIQHNPFE